MCYLFKLDLARAYRQLPSDPLDWPLLGVQWNGQFRFDRSIPFGLRHGAMNCERITSAVCHAVKKEVNSPLVAYIDDMGGPAPNDLKVAQERYEGVCSTVVKMGLDLALDKCQGPTRFMTWTGTSFDTVKMTMSIEQSKITETLDLAVSLLDRCDITLNEMEVLIGKLQHAIKFCPSGRRFMNRILRMRRFMNETDRYELTLGAKEDLLWFIQFLNRFNGSAIIR